MSPCIGSAGVAANLRLETPMLPHGMAGVRQGSRVAGKSAPTLGQHIRPP